MNGRDFTQLVNLTPGVNNQTAQDEGAVGILGNVVYSINGGRGENNNWEVDGGDNMDNGSNNSLNVFPSVDSIAEVRVLTSNYGAQYGRNASGTVETEIKSGTSSFHGDVYEFNRNNIFNDRSYFDQSSPNAPEYKKNDFGYTIGGPIYIPGTTTPIRAKHFSFGLRNGGWGAFRARLGFPRREIPPTSPSRQSPNAPETFRIVPGAGLSEFARRRNVDSVQLDWRKRDGYLGEDPDAKQHHRMPFPDWCLLQHHFHATYLLARRASARRSKCHAQSSRHVSLHP